MVAPELVIEAALAGEVVDCGLHRRNALVTGDLSAVSVPFPLTFEGCVAEVQQHLVRLPPRR